MTGDRAGIVHRLDRATSGVMICAKHPAALKLLQKQFENRTAKKTYLAVVSGIVTPDEAIINLPIERNPKAPATFRVGASGKDAQTRYEVVKFGIGKTLLELHPATGRTHQLRVHLAHISHPILGDPLYGKSDARLYLHSRQLSLTLPNGTKKTFTSPAPTSFEKVLGL
jgi:RluA family pseudouridine synthase